jgi:HEAT repeat protein
LRRGIATLIDPQALMGALYAFALSMTLVLVLLFIVLVLQKLVLERRRKVEEETFERLCAHLVCSTTTDPPPMEPTQAAHRRALSRALARLNRRGMVPRTEKLDRAQEALVSHLRRDTRHSHWGRRTAALEALGRLQIDALLPYFFEFADREPDRRVFGAALAAAARLCTSAEHLRDLGALLASKPALSRSFNESILYAAFDTLLHRADAAAGQAAIVDFVTALPPGHALVADGLAASARCNVRGILPLAQRICADPHTDLTLRLTALRALGRMQPDHALLESALRDATWEARAVAAGHLRSLRTGAVEGLRNALRDRNFHVRRNAAHALADLGEPGLGVLREMLDCDDRFARDASRAALGLQQGNGSD